MKDRLFRAAGLAGAVVLTTLGLFGPVTPATAEPATTQGADIECDTWIDGSWGKAACRNFGDQNGDARVLVTCADWWDPDVVGAWIRIPTGGLVVGASQGLQGNCWGAVESVSTETR